LNPTVGSLSLSALQAALSSGDLAFQTGPLWTRLRCQLPDVARTVHQLYAEHPVALAPDFADFHCVLRTPGNLRRWWRPQVFVEVDGHQPFEPLPRAQAPAMLEWGLNWIVAGSQHQWLTLHAASLERDGQVLVLPAPPGSGKSTLCATLALRGWRLLSDELTLVDPDSLQAHALARPISLKNESIALMRAFAPEAEWAPQDYPNTLKGLVTHMKPPADSVARMLETGRPRWIVFPRYEAGAEPELQPRSRVSTFNHFAENAFNYSILGELGFRTVAALVEQCVCFDFRYSRLEDALEVFDWLRQAHA
jgi:HprK-related kinase A